jgi:nucleoside-diphosphate-sugar epimerase
LARVLIVGCGCRGRELGGELAGGGWQVRGTSRTEAGLEPIRAVGLDAALADPDRPGTILDLCGDLGIVVWLLGSAAGEPEALAAIHGPRLERLLEKLVDTPVRGFVYEATGGAGEALGAGREITERAGETWRIPVAVLSADRGEPGWARGAAAVVSGLLAA